MHNISHQMVLWELQVNTCTYPIFYSKKKIRTDGVHYGGDQKQSTEFHSSNSSRLVYLFTIFFVRVVPPPRIQKLKVGDARRQQPPRACAGWILDQAKKKHENVATGDLHKSTFIKQGKTDIFSQSHF